MQQIKIAFAIAVICFLALITGCASHRDADANLVRYSGGGRASNLSGMEAGEAGSAASRDYAEILADPGAF